MLKIIISLFISLSASIVAQQDYTALLKAAGNYDEERNLICDVSLDNEVVYTINKILKPHFSIPVTDVLSNGNLVLIHSLEGMVEIYDKSGIVYSKNDFYSLPPYNEQTIKYAVSIEGITLIISESGKNWVYQIDTSGEEKNQFEIEAGLVTGVSQSESGKYLAYSLSKWNLNRLTHSTKIINQISEESFVLPTKFEFGGFNTETNLFFGYDKKVGFLLDLNKEQIIWEASATDDYIFVDGLIEDDNVFLVQSSNPQLVNNKWTYEKTNVFQKQKNGEVNYLLDERNPVSEISLNKKKNNIEILIDGKSTTLKSN